jgi:hypothetical protein
VVLQEGEITMFPTITHEEYIDDSAYDFGALSSMYDYFNKGELNYGSTNHTISHNPECHSHNCC